MPQKSIFEASMHHKKWWPSSDSRTELNCMCTSVPTINWQNALGVIFPARAIHRLEVLKNMSSICVERRTLFGLERTKLLHCSLNRLNIYSVSQRTALKGKITHSFQHKQSTALKEKITHSKYILFITTC